MCVFQELQEKGCLPNGVAACAAFDLTCSLLSAQAKIKGDFQEVKSLEAAAAQKYKKADQVGHSSL